MPGALEGVLQRLTVWLTAEMPEVLAALRPGVEPAAFGALESLLGQPLPADVRALYAWHDGQADDQGGHYISGLFFGLTFLPLAEVTRLHAGWQQDMADSPALTKDDPRMTSVPPGAVKTVWISPGWLPFAHDASSNYLGIDLNPGQGGTAGQVFNFGRSEQSRYVLATNLGEFLGWLASQYEAGNFVIEEEDGDRILNIREPASEHFLDAVPTLFGQEQG